MSSEIEKGPNYPYTSGPIVLHESATSNKGASILSDEVRAKIVAGGLSPSVIASASNVMGTVGGFVRTNRTSGPR